MGATGQSGFVFVHSSFLGLTAAFKWRFASNCVPSPPQNVFPKSFYCNKLGHWDLKKKIFFNVFQFCFLVLTGLVQASAYRIPSKAGT